MSDLERMHNFIASFDRLTQRGRANAFTLLRIGKDEIRHSGVLAWLLDPRGSHGQGISFLAAFTEACGLQVSSETLQRCRSRTEVSGQEAVIDVAVYSPGELLIYIEHKIDSPEGPQQIDREFADMRRHGAALGVCESRQAAVFLSPDGRPPASGCACRWRALSHGRLVEAFRPVPQRTETSESSAIVRDWLDELRSWEGVTEMLDLSDECLFIAQNWGTVEDVLAATGRLRDAFAGVLRSLQPALESRDWWQDGWELRTLRSEQVYISHRNWRVGDQPAVWIGVERFGPEGVLGHQTMAQLYVWVLAKHAALAQELGAALTAGGETRPGEVYTGGTGGYVVRHAVEKCLPEEIKGYEERATRQILGFMDHYANVLRQFDGLISQHIGSR